MDVKKLIVGFLILATAAGTSAFIISVAGDTTALSTPPSHAAATSTIPGPNAFVENAAQNSGGNGIVTYSSTASSSSDPNNLTDQLANTFFAGVVAANPNGLTQGAGGNSTLVAPDVQTIANQVASLPAATNLQIPNWDIEAEQEPLKITTGSSQADIASYSKALNDIINQRFIQTGISAMVGETNENPDQANYIESQIKAALADTGKLPTPAPLASFQQSLVRALVYENNVLALVKSGDSDPLKTSLILQAEQDKYNAAIQNLETQAQKASVLNGFSFGTPAPAAQNGGLRDPMALLVGIFGIQTAHAQWLTFDSGNFGEWLLKFANDIALQIAKNSIIALMQREVLTAIQGSGAPEFVTNWGETLVNAYQQSALSALDSAVSCVNSAFAPQIQLTLGAFYKPDNNFQCVDSFQAALGDYSAQEFYNNFNDGGFLAYGASMLPSGNYYGGLYGTAQEVAAAAQIGEQATQDKTTSAGGFTGSEICADGSNPNGTHLVCTDSQGLQESPIATSLSPGAPLSCPAGTKTTYEPNNGQCTSGQPQITTPGEFTGFSAHAAISSGPALVTAANDIAGLLNAAANSLISTLSNTAIQSAQNALNQGLAGGGTATSAPTSGGILGIQSSTIKGGGTPPAPVPLACSPYTQNASAGAAVVVGASGGTVDTSGNLPTYDWVSSDNQTGVGFTFSPAFTVGGTYTITLSDSANDQPATCMVIVK